MADFSGMIKAIKDWAVGKFITEIPIGSDTVIGAVKADGTTTTIDSDGTIHASGGGGGEGTTDYNALSNKPSIGGVTLSGNKTLEELGIQPEGNYVTEEELTQKGYLTEETDPTVPDWAKAETKPTYSKSEVGLGNVPNVATNDQTPTFTEASERANIVSGEKLSVIFGKVMKWFSDLKPHAFVAPITNLLTTVAGSALDATMGTELNNKIVANTTAIEEANSSLETLLKHINYTGTRSGVGIVGNFIQGYGCMVNIPLDRADLRNITVKSITVYGTSTVPTYTFSGTTTDGFSLIFDEDLSGKRISVSYTAPLK